jgi:hypothetical protein
MSAVIYLHLRNLTVRLSVSGINSDAVPTASTDMKLTDTFLRGIKATGKVQKHADGGGLYLLVPPTGSRLWRLDYRFNGLRKTLALGAYPTISLKDARARREEAKEQLAKGVDPAAHKQAVKADALAKKSNTFEGVSRQWLDKFQELWSQRVVSGKVSRLSRYVFPYIGGKPIDEVSASDLRDVIIRIENLNLHTVAHAVLSEISHIYRFAMSRDLVSLDLASAIRGILLPVRHTHHASITDPRYVGELLRAIDSFSGNKILALALRLLALTFVRSAELRNAEWQEIDIERAEWRIPAERMKMRKMHIVPLSRQASECFIEIRNFTGHGKFIVPLWEG